MYKFVAFVIIWALSSEAIEPPLDLVLFEPGIVSTAAPEFSFSINAEQDTIIFNRTSEDRKIIELMTSQKGDGGWEAATQMEFSEARYRELDPFLSHDGKRLYFSSTRPLIAGQEAKDFDTWYVERTSDGWSHPINPGAPLNSDATEIFFTMSKNGNAYFVSEFDGQRGVVVSRYSDGFYHPMERIQLKIEGALVYASNPCISSDERFLIVSVSVKERAPDLFVTFNLKGRWSELISLGDKINSANADFAPALSKDDRTLYFTSERPGIVPKLDTDQRPPGDIYQGEIEDIIEELMESLKATP